MKRIRRVAFRTDASIQIGTGHFMRCLTLANELRKQGVQTFFLSRNLPMHLRDMLIMNDVGYMPLGDDEAENSVDELAHSSWLGASQAKDAKSTTKELSGQIWDWLVVDHYALDARWESNLRPMVKKIMVIDDIADRKHDCDILLDQNYFVDMQNRYNDKVPIKSKLLLGPQYALLREEFRDLRSQLKVRTGEVNKILVFFGGVDRDNYTMQTIQVLSEINTELHVDVVIGFQHPFKSEIKIACVKNGFVFHEQTAYIAKLMADADLAIGAGGSAIWERCCLGLPSLLVALADNQISIARELSSIGACIYIGRSDIADLLELKKYLIELLDNRELIQQLSENAFSIADGLGVYKVMQQMRDSL